MIIRIKLPQTFTAAISITAITIGLLPAIGVAEPITAEPITAEPITTRDLLQNLRPGEPWDRSVLTTQKMTYFQQAASGGTDALFVSKMRLRYFTSSNCIGPASGTSDTCTAPVVDSQAYCTPDTSSAYRLPALGTVFGLVATSIWNVGSRKLQISDDDMGSILSVAVTLQSTTKNTPQAAFHDGNAYTTSYACINVTCTAGPPGTCSSSILQSSRFILKSSASIGDPADGGVIGCQEPEGSLSTNLNLVVTTSDQSTSQAWSAPGTIATGATSTSEGYANTFTIAHTSGLTNSSALTCYNLSVAGGFVKDWFLPSGRTSSQLSCLYANNSALTTAGFGFDTAVYWSSTEASSSNAYAQNFSNGNQASFAKTSSRRVRCVRFF